MMRHKKNDCGCGKKAKCITKAAVNRWVKSEMKRLDCGCGCKGAKGFHKKYSGGAVLGDCPAGWKTDPLTCVAPCASEERCDFDWEKYARANQDVVNAVGYNENGMRWHYDVAGKQEGRSPCGNEPTRVSTEDQVAGVCWSRCGPNQTDTGALCYNNIQSSIDPCPEGSEDVGGLGTCWGPTSQICADDCSKGWDSCRRRSWNAAKCNRWGNCPDMFGTNWCAGICEEWGGYDCIGGCPESCAPVRTITKQLHERNLKTWGGDSVAKRSYIPQITGRVNFEELNKELVTGLTYLLSEDGPLASSFDPEKNGVNDAFRKFGDDMNAVLNDINNRIKDGFNKMGDDARRAFEDLAKNAERDFKQFGDDFVAKMKDPDFWVEAIGIMAMIAGAAVSLLVTVGTLGAGGPLAVGIMAAASMAGPAAKMIAAGARGQPIDALDIAAIAVAGATALIPGMGPNAAAMMRAGTTAAGFAIAATRAAVAAAPLFGFPNISTCVGNCPAPIDISGGPADPPFDPELGGEDEPPPPSAPGEPPQLSDKEILLLQPENTLSRKLKNPRRDNPDYLDEKAWIAKYRLENYGNKPEPPSDTPLETEQDRAIREATAVETEKKPIIPTEIIDENLQGNFITEETFGDLDIPADDLIPQAPAYDNNKIYSLGDIITGSDGLTYKMIDGIGAPGYPPPRPTNWQEIELEAPVEETFGDLGIPADQLEEETFGDLGIPADELEEETFGDLGIPADELEEETFGDLGIPADELEETFGDLGIPAEELAGGSSTKSLTLYYADWCPHCKLLVPIFKKLKIAGVEIRMLEEKQNREFKVNGYPTIVYRNGSTMEVYTGSRTKSGIVNYLKNKL